jgi:C4-dicarboxylate-specific signal transduction histidine kinase
VKKLAIILGLCLVLIFTSAGCGSSGGSDRTDLKIGVSALTALADAHITDYVDSLQELAARAEVQSADWPQMNGVLARQTQTRIAASIYFMLPDGTAYIPDQDKPASNLSDRDYFPKVMAGNTVVGTLVVGRVSNTKSYVVAVPVKRDGKVVGALGTTPYLDKLSQTLVQEIGLDSSRVFYALDGNGAVALSSDTANVTAEKPVLSEDVEWKTSTLTGWRFALGFPSK